MRVVAIIQARMGSTRLPGKSLADIAGKPLLAHVIERTRASQMVESVVLATTTEPADNALLRVAESYGIACYAGSKDDVLDRYYRAATQAAADIIVRVTADDPFKDPQVMDRITQHLGDRPDLDYVSNTIEPTYPEGLDIEAFRYAALMRAWNEAVQRSEREHVTPYIWGHPERFQLANIKYSCDLSAFRWTLDYEQDLRFAREIYARLYRGQVFTMTDILRLLEAEPQLASINEGIPRNAGYLASRRNDQAEIKDAAH